MARVNYIPAQAFCKHHQIDYTFMEMLSEYGLVQIEMVEEQQCIPETRLPEIEKFMHLHYDLNINAEGMEAISHLLKRVENMQVEITYLKNKLDFYR